MSAFRARQEDGTRVDSDALFAMRHLVRRLPETPLAPTGRPGPFVGRRRGNGLEIVDVRLYQDGDDMRHVDAAATARTGRRHTRTFRDERDRAAFLLADLRRPMLWGTRVRLRSVAAAGALAIVGWRVVEAGGRIGLMTLAGEAIVHLRARGREAAMAGVSSALGQVHSEAFERARVHGTGEQEPTLDVALDRALSLASRGSTLVLATALDSPGDDFATLVSAARRRVRLRVLLMRDAFERSPPAGTYPFMGEGPRASALGWARVREERAAADRPEADPRLELLEQCGAEAIVLDTDQGWAEMALAVGAGDGG